MSGFIQEFIHELLTFNANNILGKYIQNKNGISKVCRCLDSEDKNMPPTPHMFLKIYDENIF